MKRDWKAERNRVSYGEIKKERKVERKGVRRERVERKVDMKAIGSNSRY